MATDSITSNTPKRRNGDTTTRLRRSRRCPILVLCALGATLLLASCAANQATPTSATHKMVGTNSPGY
jgi:hypothetical protein